MQPVIPKESTSTTPSPETTIRYSKAMGSVLSTLIKVKAGSDSPEDEWMLITDIERQSGRSSSGVRSILDRLATAALDAENEQQKLIEVRDHLSAIWVNPKTNESFKRQEVRLTGHGFLWAIDYNDQLIKGAKGAGQKRKRPTLSLTTNSTVVRATPISSRQ